MNESMLEYRVLIRLLVARRHQLKLTQVGVSSRMRIEVNLVNRWENFRRFPKGPMLIRWARALGLSLDIDSVRPTAWACRACNKVDWADTEEQLAAPEHRSHRGFDIGDCRGKMVPLYEKSGAAREMKKLEGRHPSAQKAPARAEDAALKKLAGQ